MSIEIQVLASGSKGNAYLVSDGVSNVLIEAGISFREIQVKSGFKRVDFCLVSHRHRDHCYGVKELCKYGIPCYMPYDTKDFLKLDSHNANIVDAGRDYFSVTWEFRPFELEHDCTTFGYYIRHKQKNQALVYITDSFYCKYTFPGVTHWIVECNNSRDILDENVENGTLNASLRNRIVQSHMSLETLKELFKVNNLSKTEEIILCHLSNDNSDADRFKREIQETTGKVVRIA